MQTVENSIIEARIFYHSNSYTYIVLLFAVKFKFMTLWLNTINSSALSGLLYLIKHLLILNKLFRVLSVGSRVALCTSCVNSINKLWSATILR